MIRHVFKLIWNRKRTNFLVMTEIFVSFLVLFAVVAIGAYMWDNWRRPVGYSIDRLWNVSVDVRQTSDDDFTEEQVETTRQLLLALGELPQVEQVAGIQIPLYSLGASSVSEYEYRGREIEYGVTEVTDAFKDLVGLKIVEGRWFGPDDLNQNYDAVVINRDMRVDVFGDGPAIGENLSSDRTPDGADAPRERRVIGVVEAFREDGELDGMRNYVVFRKNLENPTGGRDRPPRNLLIKVAPGTTAAFEEPLVRRLQAVAPAWGFEVQSVAAAREGAIEFALVPLAIVGLVAGFLMLMVALGLLGVLWQNVTQRTREIGLRRAKGAARVNVRRQILGEIAVMTALAVGAGVLVAVQFPLLNVIYFVEPHVYAIGITIAGAAIFLLTLLCGWYPSRMATLVDPAEALRYE